MDNLFGMKRRLRSHFLRFNKMAHVIALFTSVRTAALFCAALFTFACERSGGELGEGQFINRNPLDATPVVLTLGEHRYSIPGNFIDSGSQDGGYSDGVLLFVTVPEYEGKTKGNFERFRTTQPNGQWMSVHLSAYNYDDRTPKDVFLNKVKTYLKNVEPYSKRTESDGTVYFDVGERESWDRSKDIYIHYKDDEPEVMIACSNDQAVPSPGCSQFFMYKNLVIDLNYRKNKRSEWRERQRAVEELLDSFRVKDSK